MLKPSVEVNNCYILQSKMGETLLFEHWKALAIYAPNQFLLRFIKPSVLSKEEEGHLRTEALQEYRLIHPALDTVVEADFFKGRLFISSEYRDQVLLRDFPTTKIKTDAVWIERLVLHLATALEFFHAHGFLYGVFLPESVLVARNGNNPEDFTFLKPGYRTTLATLLKQNSKSTESPYRPFMAPELLSGGDPSIAADLYSFGMLMGVLWDSTVLPPAVDRIVKTCTQAEPKDRYPNGTTLIKEIEALLKTSAPESFFILPSTGGTGKQNATPSGPTNPAVPPVSQARTEVLHYFQEISANYRSEHGYTEGGPGDGSSGTAVPPAPLPASPASTRPRPVGPAPSTTPSVRDDYYSQWSLPANPQPAAKVTSTPAPVTPAPAASAPATPAPATPAPVASAPAIPAPAAPAAPAPSQAGSAASAPSGGARTVPQTPTVSSGPAAKGTAATVSQKVPAGAAFGAVPSEEPVRWQYHCVSLEAVEKTLVRTFMRSKKGIGDFRFIQEGQDSESKERLKGVLKFLAQDSFFIDGGSLCGTQKADVRSFLSTIQGALERPLSQETARSRRRFGSLIDAAGVPSFFSTGRLGDLLFKNRKSGETPPATYGKDTYDGLIEALTCFGRKKRPQVIVARGSECIGSDLSEFLVQLAREIRYKSVCVFIFGQEFPAEFQRFRSENAGSTPVP